MNNNHAGEMLLVEDDPRDEGLILRALEKRNLANKVKVVRDGAEALDYLFAAEPSEDGTLIAIPKVILLDLNLPKVDGLEVLRKVKSHKRTKAIPVVVLTSSREDSDMIENYRLGVNSYIVKPVDFNKFMEAVGDLGRYWLMLNKLPY